MSISIFIMIIISTPLTAPTQPSPRFHAEAWLPFRNREMDYSGKNIISGLSKNFGKHTNSAMLTSLSDPVLEPA